LLLGGCVPATVTDVPALTGRVIDLAGRPVAGATVVVTKVKGHGGPFKPVRFPAGPGGEIASKERARWGLWLVPGDPETATLSVKAVSESGAESPGRDVTFRRRVRLWGFTGSPARADVGDLRLPQAADAGP
jgi:hypothetical protein